LIRKIHIDENGKELLAENKELSMQLVEANDKRIDNLLLEKRDHTSIKIEASKEDYFKINDKAGIDKANEKSNSFITATAEVTAELPNSNTR